MQLPLATSSDWRTILLLFSLSSRVSGATEMNDLSKLSGMPIAQLHEPEIMRNGFYVVASEKKGGFKHGMLCDDETGQQYKFFTAEDGSKLVACCGADEYLSGSLTNGLSCCGAGHKRTGSPAAGYSCCPDGYTYEDKMCKPPGASCPLGTILDASGQCVVKPCVSGIVTGKCYQITNRDGRRWGYLPDFACYSASDAGDESTHFKAGKFQFCMDESCTKGVGINPSDGFSIRDMHGVPPAGNNPNSWLNNAKGGTHVGKTWNYSKAGRFSITKWPYGRYCIGGASPNGLRGGCSAKSVGIPSAAGNAQACIEVTLKEVPCDIRATTNNCIWKSPDDPCYGGLVNCPVPATQPAVGPAAQKPVKASSEDSHTKPTAVSSVPRIIPVP